MAPSSLTDRFAVSPGMRAFGYVCHEFPRFWKVVEGIESSLIRDRLAEISIKEPVYVTGLARSGTTILLELIANLPEVATHRYRDFPPIWTPYIWNRFLQLVPKPDLRPVERPHGDGIEITPDSPEAMEEAIWMRFFPDSHDPLASSQLGRTTRNDAFADFYRRHIQKLLLIRGGQRYLSKGNYNVARLAYIQELFPDARFILPIRHPVGHVASLMRQHEVFSKGQESHPSARAYLRRVGHFEFGLDRAPMNMGNADSVKEILARWSVGDELSGWALYWSHVYGSVLDQLDADQRLREAVLILRYEDLCSRPQEELTRVMNHCRLDVGIQKIGAMSSRLRRPDYYSSGFDEADERTILASTHATMSRYGYPTGPNDRSGR